MSQEIQNVEAVDALIMSLAAIKLGIPLASVTMETPLPTSEMLVQFSSMQRHKPMKFSELVACCLVSYADAESDEGAAYDIPKARTVGELIAHLRRQATCA